MPISQLAVLFIFISLPWLSPLTFGPSAATVPWLVSLASLLCLALYIGMFVLDGYVNKIRLFLAGMISLAFILPSLRHDAASETFFTMLAVIGIAVTAWASCRFVEHKNNTRILAKVWLIVALISCVFAMLQYLSLESRFAPLISASSDGTAYANLRQRNQFASLTGIGYLCVLFLYQKAFLPVTSNALGNLVSVRWCWIALTVLAVGNGLSSSRTGALQWLLIAAVTFYWRGSLRDDVRRLAYGALGIYALAVAVMPWFAQWVGNSNTGLWGRAQDVGVVGGGRMALYSNVIDLIAMKPWFGWGWRELAYAHYSTHFDVRFVELVDNAHNLPLHLAVELGVPFAVLFCGAVLWWIVRNAPWRETDPTRQLAWGILMLIGVHSMVEYPLWYGPFLMTLGICIGLLQRSKKEQNSAHAQVFIAQVAIKSIAIGLLCITAYLAFDYHRVSQIYLSEEDRSTLYRDDVMGAAKRSVVFKKHAQFAELVTTPVTPQTAPHVLELALKLVHFSPEPRVIEPLIESATMLHFDDIAMFHLERYKAMYPKDYAAWSALK
jgi:Virulence factor membrane-bound polymerase, C-terminal/Protein glycosylation ligase